MNTARPLSHASPFVVIATLLFSAYAPSALGDEIKVVLSGSQEIPPVTTAASGTGTVTVGADKSVRGSVTITGMTPTVAHIHEGPAGKIGPVIIPLVQTADGVWSVPEGAKLTDSQYESYKAGNLYYNVHSATYKPGEFAAR